MNPTRKNYIGGLLMMVVGVAAFSRSVTYQIGTLTTMGPGFFPAALGALLALTGAVIFLTARLGVTEGEAKHHPPEWRGWACIGLGIVAFTVLGQYGGLVPATFAITFISALGDRKNSVLNAALLAVGIVGVCLVVFWWALQLNMPLFQWG